MTRGPYFFVQWRTHKSSTTQHCYIWCQWETGKGTDGVARSVTRHGLEGAIRAVIKAAEQRIGKRLRIAAQSVIDRLESMA